MKSQIIRILVIVFGFTLAINGQQGTITGSVSDSNTNDPLPGVNVIVKKHDEWNEHRFQW